MLRALEDWVASRGSGAKPPPPPLAAAALMSAVYQQCLTALGNLGSMLAEVANAPAPSMNAGLR